MEPPVVYIAGPLFDRSQRWYNTQLSNAVKESGFETYMPQDASGEIDLSIVDNRGGVFEANLEAIRSAAFVVANLNGAVIDAGTAWECGYAWALGKKVVGVREQARGDPPHRRLNLMLERSVTLLADIAALKRYLSQPFSF